MNNGFIKVAAATPKIKVGDCKHNAVEICSLIREAYRNKTQLIVFPEQVLQYQRIRLRQE